MISSHSAGGSSGWAGSAFIYPETSRRQSLARGGYTTHAPRAVQNFWTRDRTAQGEQNAYGAGRGRGRHAAHALLLTRMNIQRSRVRVMIDGAGSISDGGSRRTCAARAGTAHCRQAAPSPLYMLISWRMQTQALAYAPGAIMSSCDYSAPPCEQTDVKMRHHLSLYVAPSEKNISQSGEYLGQVTR